MIGQHGEAYSLLLQLTPPPAAAQAAKRPLRRQRQAPKPHAQYLPTVHAARLSLHHITVHKNTPAPVYGARGLFIQFLAVVMPAGEIIQRIDPNIIFLNAEVEMGTGGVTGGAGPSDQISLPHRVAKLNIIGTA